VGGAIIFVGSVFIMTLKALVNLVENNKNFTVDQKSVHQNLRKEEKITAIIRRRRR
jgi:hypothetical protein